MHLYLGCIADDLTGGADLSLMLAQHGLPTTLFMGLPDRDVTVDTGAVVIALKIRTEPADRAVGAARQAADWLLERGAEQLYYKYCSTFDSTSSGNIGPICDALLDTVTESATALVPAFPANGRTVRDGHLYVDDIPLHKTSMRHHPLTPMTDSFLPRLMDAQTAPGRTGVVAEAIVKQGPEAIAAAMAVERDRGRRYIVIDSTSDGDLRSVAAATRHCKLLTGGSGLGAAIPAQLRAAGLSLPESGQRELPALPGRAAVLAGSCSAATREQVSVFRGQSASFEIDPIALAEDGECSERLAKKAIEAVQRDDVLLYSSAEPDKLKETQDQLGIAAAATLVEDALGSIARRLSDVGVCKFITAGGETSGAVAQSLQMTEFDIAAEIAPGVPWLVTTRPKPTCIAFKSGNFGQADFFCRALEMLP